MRCLYLMLVSGCLSACAFPPHSVPVAPSTCAAIQSQLVSSSPAYTGPTTKPVTQADHARLLQEYQDYNCPHAIETPTGSDFFHIPEQTK